MLALHPLWMPPKVRALEGGTVLTNSGRQEEGSSPGQLLLAEGEVEVEQAFAAFKIVLEGDPDNVPGFLLFLLWCI
ncbi:hypothetical protein V6N11_007111 [Hibiscus sabdariffa]|uniref:Uncharacterized protein n=1 Tax=Hibiscus sabdariffa TaxID=183260 RepID=A0ABR2RT84_9ROSI